MLIVDGVEDGVGEESEREGDEGEVAEGRESGEEKRREAGSFA